MTLPTQPLPSQLQMIYGYWDGTNALHALPVKMTPNSQVADFVVFAQDGTSSLKSNVRHQSSGDTNYWYSVVRNQTS